VGALYFVGALSLLFKSVDGAGFATKSALTGVIFESPIAVVSRVVAVVLVTRGDEPSSHARTVVLAALGIGALDLFFGVVTFFAQFGADSSFGVGFAGIPLAGKIVGLLIGLAHLLFLASAGVYFFVSYLALPAPVTAGQPQWGGTGPGYGQYGGAGQQPAWGFPGAGQQAWGQQTGPRADQQGWGQGGWGQQSPPAGWGTPSGSTAWGESAATGWQQPPASTTAPPSPGFWDRPAQGDWPQPGGSAPTGSHAAGTAWPAPSWDAPDPAMPDPLAPEPARPEPSIPDPAAPEPPNPPQPIVPEPGPEPADPDPPTPEPTGPDPYLADDAGTDDVPPSRGWWQRPET
jgi:hypothetical protein